MMKLAQLHCPDSIELLSTCYLCIMEHFEDLSDDDMAVISQTDMVCILDLEEQWDNSEHPNCEEAKFTLIQKWVGAKEDDGRSFPRLIQSVDLCAVSPEFFRRAVESEKLMQSQGCVEALQEARHHLSMLKKKPPVIAVYKDGEIWQLHMNAWEKCPTMPSMPSVPYSMASSYLAEERSTETILMAFISMIVDAKAWEKLPQMLMPRSGHHAVYCHGAMFLIGGHHSWLDGVLSTVEKLDPSTGKWPLPSLSP
jgi:hypothetical protein